MAVPDLNPLRRDVLLALLAIGLLAGPLYAAALHLGAPTYEYDRVEVTTTDRGIEYSDQEQVPPRTPISDDLDCVGWGDLRACTFERHLLDEGFLPTEVYSTNPNYTSAFSVYSRDYYDYVQIDDAVYEPTYVTNTSARRDDGMYRVDATIEPADPDEVLDRVAVDADDDLPSVVAETARSGTTTAPWEVDVPEAPIRLADGTYYRVYRERGVTEPSSVERLLSSLLTYVAPVVGVVVLGRLSRRIEVSYRGDREA